MSAQPCKECKRRPKVPGRHRCVTCQLRQAPIGEQVEAARRRLAMVPEEMRLKRSKKIVALSPAGSSWCAGCQSFRDLEDFPKNGTTCRACASARQHAAMVEKTYGITGDDYDSMLKRQGGKCAICRARPISKRFAVDHDHKTGEPRGLLCSRCNHDLLGNAWDSLAIATALWHYLNTPPASGAWRPPEAQARLAPVEAAVRPADALEDEFAIVSRRSEKKPRGGDVASEKPECERTHYRPTGSVADPRGAGYWRIYVEDGAEIVPPF